MVPNCLLARENACQNRDWAVGDGLLAVRPASAPKAHLSGMLRGGNMTVAGAMLAVIPVVMMLLLATPVMGQDDKGLLEAPMVDWSVGKAVYQQADQWVEAGKVERNPAARPLLVSGVVAVRVTLRFGGLTLAVGDALAPPAKANAPVDLRELTARATERALIQFDETRRRSIPVEPVANIKDKAKAPAPEQEAIRLELDLQIAHSPTEVILPAAAPAKSIYYQFASGYHGLRLINTAPGAPGAATPAPAQAGAAPLVALTWPANALASNLLPDSQIRQLLSDVGYNAAEMITVAEKISREGGPRLQRLEVIHLVRPTRGQPVYHLTRGNEVIPAQAVDQRTIDSMARRLTRHLITRIIAEGATPGMITGTYQPTTDRYDPIEASDFDTALTAYVLSRRAVQLGAADPEGLDFLNTREKTRIVLTYLRKKLVDTRPNEGDPLAKALLMLTMIETPWLAELRPERDKLAASLMALQVDKGVFVNPATRTHYAAEGQAILLLALSSLYEQTRDDRLPMLLEPAMDALWGGKISTTDLITAMPWMSMATIRLHRVNIATQVDDTAKAFERQRWGARSGAMRSLSENLRSKRLIRSTPEIGPADVIGGYDLINETEQGVPTPDWRAANVLAFLATTTSDGDIFKTEDKNRFMFDTTLTVRFLAQLMFDEPSSFYIRGDRRDSIDGVRYALWDNRLAAKPSAMTLLAITELQQAVAAME